MFDGEHPAPGALFVDALDPQHELAAAVARDQVAGAGVVAQDAGERHQHLVAGRRSVPVVDQLQVEDVDVEQHGRLRAAIEPQQAAGEFVEEGVPVGERGQRIGARHRGDALARLDLRDHDAEMVGDIAQQSPVGIAEGRLLGAAPQHDRALAFAAILHGMGRELTAGGGRRGGILVLDCLARRHQPGGRQFGAPGDGGPRPRIAARAQYGAAGRSGGKAERGERGGERAFGLGFIAHRAHHLADDAVADMRAGLGQILGAGSAANAERAVPQTGGVEHRPRREGEQDGAAIGGAKPDFSDG